MEPENQPAILPLLRAFREKYPQKSIWCYSGYTYEQLTGTIPARCRCACTDELLSLIDVLVEGRFVLAQKDISLKFRGSRNQRIVDMNKSREAGEIVLWNEGKRGM